jgi:hypothetical protein
MMFLRFTHNDVMFAPPMSRRTHHTRQRTSLPPATSFARQGKHHSKTRDLVDKSRVFDGGEYGTSLEFCEAICTD